MYIIALFGTGDVVSCVFSLKEILMSISAAVQKKTNFDLIAKNRLSNLH